MASTAHLQISGEAMLYGAIITGVIAVLGYRFGIEEERSMRALNSLERPHPEK
jgi:hypothetical protein